MINHHYFHCTVFVSVPNTYIENSSRGIIRIRYQYIYQENLPIDSYWNVFKFTNHTKQILVVYYFVMVEFYIDRLS